MMMQAVAMIIVVIITVVFRPMWSPIYPKIKAPKGLKRYVEQKAKAVRREAVLASAFGKKISFKIVAI